jgi:hypothetical protein
MGTETTELVNNYISRGFLTRVVGRNEVVVVVNLTNFWAIEISLGSSTTSEPCLWYPLHRLHKPLKRRRKLSVASLVFATSMTVCLRSWLCFVRWPCSSSNLHQLYLFYHLVLGACLDSPPLLHISFSSSFLFFPPQLILDRIITVLATPWSLTDYAWLTACC